jgi:hypothetical protein
MNSFVKNSRNYNTNKDCNFDIVTINAINKRGQSPMFNYDMQKKMIFMSLEEKSNNSKK